MSSRSRGSTTSFHDEAPDDASYKKLIQKVKSSKQIKPDRMEGTPHFDRLPEPVPEAPTQLSEKTVEGLEALNAEMERKALEEAEMMEMEEEAPPPPEKTQEEKVREAIEDRCEPIDIGQYLMGGELTQKVPIIPPRKLLVRFRTVTDLEEVYVDDQLSSDDKMTGRQFVRRTNEWALATHIHSLNDAKWPTIFDGDGTVSKKAMDIRMSNVHKISSPVFNLIVINLGWFLDRVNQSLTAGALGNG